MHVSHKILLFLFVSCFIGRIQAQEASEIAYRSVNVAGNIYLLSDPAVPNADNIIVSVGTDGVLLVDNGFMETLNSVRPLIEDFGDRVNILVNTHFHHAGANEVFGTEAAVIAHRNTLKRMKQTSNMYGRFPIGPWPESALPNIVVDDSLTLNFNGERIKLVYLPNAHTDGDLAVFFTESNVVATGDIFVPALGVCDFENGGDWYSYLSAVEKLVELIPKDAYIIPGHGPVSTYEDLKRSYRMLQDITRWIENRIDQGWGLNEILKEGLTEQCKDLGEKGLPENFFIENAYKGITRDQ